jgi:hypothetical protein
MRCHDSEAPAAAGKTYSPKIEGLVDEISSMTIIEVADLVEALKVSHIPSLSRIALAYPLARFLAGSLPCYDRLDLTLRTCQWQLHLLLAVLPL